MHTTSITLTTLALALAISAPSHAKKKADPKAEDARSTESEKADKKADDSPAATDDLWFEAPIVAAPVKSPDSKAKKKKPEAPRYGLDLGLHNARNKRQAPKVEERAEDMSRKLTQTDVRRVIRRQHAAIGFCGQRAAKKGERATQVLLHLEIDSKGAARGVSVTDVPGKKLPAMSTCMAHAARGWKFPADTAGGDIEYPLMLNRR
jgi:hypothetical protein